MWHYIYIYTQSGHLIRTHPEISSKDRKALESHGQCSPGQTRLATWPNSPRERLSLFEMCSYTLYAGTLHIYIYKIYSIVYIYTWYEIHMSTYIYIHNYIYIMYGINIYSQRSEVRTSWKRPRLLWSLASSFKPRPNVC